MSVVRDVHAGLRLARRAPLVSLGGILCIALGIGATTTLYDVLDRVVLRPLAYPHPHQLVMMRASDRAKNIIEAPISFGEFSEWRRSGLPAGAMAAYQMGAVSLADADLPERLDAARASEGLFELLGVRPALGRTLNAADAAPGSAPVAVISDRLWRRQFNADDAVIGRAVRLNNRAVSIVGVLPATFREAFGLQPDCWIPLWFDNPTLQRPDVRTLIVIGRIAPGVNLAAQHGWSIDVLPLEAFVARGWKSPAIALFAAVVLVLLIACINVATLLLARTAERGREFALRLCLGASPRHLARLLIAETLVLAVPGAVGGLACAYGLQRLLIWLRPAYLSRLDQMGLHVPVLVAATIGMTATVALCTSLPLWYALRGPRRGPRQDGVLRRSLTMLTIGEIALGLALLVAATVVTRDLVERLPKDQVDWRDKLTIRLTLPADRYATREERVTFLREAADRLRALPGVTAIAEASIAPFDRYMLGAFVSSSTSRDEKLVRAPLTTYSVANPEFFSSLRLRLTAGRAFTVDDSYGAAGVFIVSQSLAQRLWPERDPLHQPLSIDVFNPTGSLHGDVKRDGEVVGVVPDEGQLLVYAPLAQHTIPFTRIIVSAPHAAMLAREVRLELRKLDPALVPDEVMTLEEMAGQRVELSRFYMMLTQVFASVGLLLATIGVYAITSYLVHRRRHELAVRVALGATPWQVLAQVATNGVAIVLTGLALGSITAFVARKLIIALIVGSTDSTSFSTTSFALAATGVAMAVGVALLVGALRAIRLDPIQALREL